MFILQGVQATCQQRKLKLSKQASWESLEGKRQNRKNSPDEEKTWKE